MKIYIYSFSLFQSKLKFVSAEPVYSPIMLKHEILMESNDRLYGITNVGFRKMCFLKKLSKKQFYALENKLINMLNQI